MRQNTFTAKTTLIDGFSLIELLVAIAILAILAAMAVQSAVIYRKQGYYAKAVADLRNARTSANIGLNDSPSGYNVGWTWTDATGGPVPAALSKAMPGATTSSDVRMGVMFRACQAEDLSIQMFIAAYPCKSDKFTYFLRFCNGLEILSAKQPFAWNACGF